MQRSTALFAVFLALTTGPAAAHTGAGDALAFSAGLLHPPRGLDHLLAMVGVGLWSAQLGGRALWAIPAIFVASMAAGLVLAWMGATLPLVETGIAASVLILGVAVAAAARAPLVVAMALAASFALLHGHAHGTESVDGSIALFGLGVLLATALLHATGVALASAARPVAHAVRWSGAAIAVAGLGLVLAQ
jgi:urease accessory protein